MPGTQVPGILPFYGSFFYFFPNKADDALPPSAIPRPAVRRQAKDRSLTAALRPKTTRPGNHRDAFFIHIQY